MKRILIVEDDPHVQRAIANTLKGLPVEIETAKCISAMIYSIIDYPPDLITMDYNIENGETGARAFKRLREFACTAPVLAITGQDDSNDELVGLGAVGAFKKPWDNGELRRVVCQILDLDPSTPRHNI